MAKLTQEQIDQRLESLSEWSQATDKIQRTFAFDDFVNAMEFVNRVAELAEEVAHHPDILIRYNKVTLTLTTHDAGGLTEKDFDVAVKADGIVAVQTE